ncbi:hypothetical protein [Saccharibacillus sacchari]|uniref:Uncharacterized protein n=1 Tax=Saccharibacillus sacchari TaxID=456493 RepID=A0ACC6PAG1_9BACL
MIPWIWGLGFLLLILAIVESQLQRSVLTQLNHMEWRRIIRNLLLT